MKAEQHTTYNKKNITLTSQKSQNQAYHRQRSFGQVTAAGVNPLDNMISRGEVKMIVLTNPTNWWEMKSLVSLSVKPR